MLQKPSLEDLERLSKTHLFLMDIGIWILSDRAIEVLMKRQKLTDATGSLVPVKDEEGTSAEIETQK